MAVNAGRLKARVTFERFAETRNATGGAERVWSALYSRWAEIKPLSGREQIEGGALAGVQAYRATVRYEDARDLTTDDRLTLQGIPYNIRTITDPTMNKRWLEMLIERGVAN